MGHPVRHSGRGAAGSTTVQVLKRHPQWAGQEWIETGMACLCAEHAKGAPPAQ
ncbi:hypothetical protein [Streptomyces zagrosensis]|uniref:Integrase n=1 Tax=Streptomyces zagrosensis TaxID=1042984 RepID=A0A7W9QEB2_9ACTN|nr:hypothetical protein [Streptomyces zagrosensis]MBB5938708.1 hypothetical protein [Streptomyces zagrosensis]